MPELAGRDNHYHRQRTKRLRRSDDPCWLCHKPIDKTLYYTHPMSWTSDHVVPIQDGGKLDGLMRPAHRSCNSKRNKSTLGDAVICATHGPGCTTSPHSREW